VWNKKYTVGAAGSGGTFTDIVADTSGNIYCVGFISLPTPANYQIVFANMSATSGVIAWQYYLDSATVYADVSTSIDLASSGNLYIAGYSQPSGYEGFLAKVSSSGAVTWQRKLTATNGAISYAIKADANETVWAGSVSSYTVNSNIVITKFPTSGIAGTYTPMTYAVSTLNRSTGTLTESSPSITTAAGSFTDAARTLTAGTPTLTNTLTSIP
jgi:outer membrane protein assembly factor BamB